MLTLNEQGEPKSASRVIRSAVLVNLLNPKLTIFFFAFLPQFVPSHSSHAVPTMLSSVFIAMTFIVFAAYGIFAAGAREHLIARPHIIKRIRRVFAVSFVALGAKLASIAFERTQPRCVRFRKVSVGVGSVWGWNSLIVRHRRTVHCVT